MIPTIDQVLKHYGVIAQSERAKTGRPCARTVQNAVLGTTLVCRAGGVELAQPISCLTRRVFDAALATFVEQGKSRVTAWSYVMQLRSVFAQWALPYYKDAGWKIPKLNLPRFRAKAMRYQRPGLEKINAVKAWYRTLEGAKWFAATMMLEFAMRNGDVMRLKDDNFVLRGKQRFLDYTPHKTELTSGRRVFWPVHEDIWSQIESLGGMAQIDAHSGIFDELNADMRRMGFTGNKGCYELRKMCIDHVYQKFGAEMAVSISGDDIRTITHYYADPAQPNIGELRIIDLL